MSAVATAPQDPYIGPRAFRVNETLYGRKRETVELSDLLIAERIVLFYSPSGAGKTSLLRAALYPSLQKAGFRVRPIIRVNLDPLATLGDRSVAVNRYVLSTIVSLERQSADHAGPLSDELLGLDLDTYLTRRPAVGDQSEPEVLIFDQFEEILTVDPTDQNAKAEFFAQVGVALRNRRRWALFSMREDYIAGLDPYLRLIPTRLGTTFRLDLLGASAARQAIQEPVKEFGVTFADAAADTLIDDLRRIRVQRPDGSTDEPLGPHVEPVQLQVVCLRLWQHRDPNATKIDSDDVEHVGDVDTALADYYAERVEAIAAETEVPERRIREWIEEYLITPQNMRGQVLQEPGASQGLDNRVIQALENAYLVRGDRRRGATWYELAHDRLIRPILANNATWFARNLNTLQAQARLWERQRRPDDLLLRDPALLEEAKSWAAEHEGKLEPFEDDFMRESLEARAANVRDQRRNLLIKRMMIGALVTSAIAIAAFAAAFIFFNQARQNAELALARQLAAQSLSRVDDLDLSLLLSLEGLRVSDNFETRGSLLTALEHNPRLGAFLRGHTSEVRNVAFSPDGRLLASCSEDGTVILWDVDSGRQLGSLDGAAWGLGFSPDGRLLVIGTEDGSLIFLDVDRREPWGPPVNGHTRAVTRMAFSPDGKLLATGARDSTARLWDVESRQPIGGTLSGHGSGDAGEVWGIAFSPDGKLLATGGRDSHIVLWDVAIRQPRGDRLDYGMWVRSLAFSPDGKTLAAGGGGGAIKLWDVASRTPTGPAIKGHANTILGLAYSADGTQLASAGIDPAIVLWDLRPGEKAGQPIGEPLTGHTDWIWSVAFSPDGARLASSSRDTRVVLWNLEERHRLGQPLGTHEDYVTSVAFSPDGKQVASASNDKSVVLWDVVTGIGRVLRGRTGEGDEGVRSVAFSQDGKLLVSGGLDNRVLIWDLQTLQQRLSPQKGPYDINGVAFSPDSTLVGAVSCAHIEGSPPACLRSVAQLWEVANPSRAERLEMDVVGGIFSLAFSPDGKVLGVGVGIEDPRVLLWDLPSRRLTEQPIRGFSGLVRSLAFSPNGKLLAVGVSDGRIRLWDVASRQMVGEPLRGSGGAVRGLAFTRDGKILASGSADGWIMLWDVAQGQTLGPPLRGDPEAVWSVSFSPDGNALVSGGDDGTVVLWNLDLATRMNRACKVAGRNLTQSEWRRYLGDRRYQKTCPELPSAAS